jgi:hypothetical protein
MHDRPNGQAGGSLFARPPIRTAEGKGVDMRVLTSPGAKARFAGGLWVVCILFGLFAEAFVRGSLVVRGDPAATAANILASEQLFRLGFVADLIGTGAYVGTTFLLYVLLKPVNRHVSLFACLLGLAGSTILLANLSSHLGALYWLQGAAPQPAMAMMSLRLHSLGYNISMMVFAAQVLLWGCLVLKSTFFPKFIGFLLAIEWFCVWLNGLSGFLFPDFDLLDPYIMMPALVAEAGFALWLLVMGVNAARWREQGALVGEDASPGG